jgi:hypothetical protein
MKKYLLIASLVTGSFFARAQTKGTNTLGFGLNFQNSKTELADYSSKTSNASYSLGYGYFIKENQKASLTLFFGRTTVLDRFTNGAANQPEERVSNSYGGSLGYQKYFPLLKKFYGFAGARTVYNFSEGSLQANAEPLNYYSAGVHGGVSWTLFKRLSLEADLLSADIIHQRSESINNRKFTSTKFDLSTSGPLNGLGFRIYFMF